MMMRIWISLFVLFALFQTAIAESDLNSAIDRADIETLNLLLQIHIATGIGVNACDPMDPMYESPLHRAVAKGNPEVTHMLMGAGADPLARNRLNQTPLHVAVRHGHIAVVSVLINYAELKRSDLKYAELEALDNLNRTPLQLALAQYPPNWRIVEMLIDAKASPEGALWWLQNTLHHNENPYDRNILERLTQVILTSYRRVKKG